MARIKQIKHVEKHFTASETVRDVVIGMSDGLTVPFALAAGMVGAVAASKLVVTAGIAEIAAGSIAMGLGGYLAAKSDEAHYESEWKRERKEIVEVPEEEKSEVRLVFSKFGLKDDEINPIVERLSQRPDDWVHFMMQFELGIEPIAPGRALSSALTIAGSYVVGGLIPLAPYIVMSDAHRALRISILVTTVGLILFGFAKGKLTGQGALKNAVQTTVIGGLAAAVAFMVARLVS